jgi:uncharacterized membrane protein YagU involved in acid resistance
MKRLNVVSVIVAGFVATAAMTMMMMAGPLMGMPKMEIAKMLAGFMNMPVAMGWVAHFMIGLTLSVGYAILFATNLKLPRVLRGAVYGLVPWLMAQLIVMPMMGMGLFSGSVVMATGSLLGHLLYGSVLGAIYRPLPCVEGMDCGEHKIAVEGSTIV